MATTQPSLFGDLYNLATVEKAQADKNAYDIAQLAPGRASVYGAAKAGGMLGRGVGKALGMTTSDQERKQLKVQHVLSQFKDSDPSSAETQLAMGKAFIDSGLPNIGQQLIDKSQATATAAADLALRQGALEVSQERLVHDQNKLIKTVEDSAADRALREKEYETNASLAASDIKKTEALVSKYNAETKLYETQNLADQLTLQGAKVGDNTLSDDLAKSINKGNLEEYKMIFETTDAITGEPWQTNPAYVEKWGDTPPTFTEFIIWKTGGEDSIGYSAYLIAGGVKTKKQDPDSDSNNNNAKTVNPYEDSDEVALDDKGNLVLKSAIAQELIDQGESAEYVKEVLSDAHNLTFEEKEEASLAANWKVQAPKLASEFTEVANNLKTSKSIEEAEARVSKAREKLRKVEESRGMGLRDTSQAHKMGDVLAEAYYQLYAMERTLQQLKEIG